MQLPLPQLRGNRPMMALLALVVLASAGTYAASSLRGQVAPLSPVSGQMGYCCNTTARSCDGPFLAANPAMCNVPGYSGLLFSYGQNNDAQREESFRACQVACGIPVDDVECPMYDCAMPMVDTGCHLVEGFDEAGCPACPQVVCDEEDGEECIPNFRCPVPMLDPGCRLEEDISEKGCALCPRVVCDGDEGGGDGPVCFPPPCAVPIVPEDCRLEGTTDDLGCPLCPTVVCDSPIDGDDGGEEECRPPERCPVPELTPNCRMEERFDERGCAECPGVVCEDIVDGEEGGGGGPTCTPPPCAVPFVPEGCRLLSQSDDQGCPVCPTLVCDGGDAGQGGLTQLDPPQVVGGTCRDIFPQLQFISRSGRFVGFTANHAVDAPTQFNVATLYIRDRESGEVTTLPNAIEATLEGDGTVRYRSYQKSDRGSIDIVERTFSLPPEEGYAPALPDPASIGLRDDRIHTIRRVTGASEDGRFALIIGLGPTYIRDKDFQYVARVDLEGGFALPLNATLNWEGLPYNLNDSEVITAFMSANGDVVAMNNSAVSGNHDVSQLYVHTISNNVLEHVCSN